ncbi:hypothetical protein ACP70R_037953 [Stipagrostis hirtigluma subsp. patula]
MAAMTESSAYGEYVLLEPEARHKDDNRGEDDVDPPLMSVLVKLCVSVALCCGLIYVSSLVFDPADPQFSVRITGAQGLDDLRSPGVSPSFNLTMHVDNGWSLWPACRPNSAVTMYYGDTSVAWGEVPAFCIDKRSAIDLDVSLSSKGAILSRTLRLKMASEKQERGLVLNVEMKPANPERYTPGHVSSRATQNHLSQHAFSVAISQAKKIGFACNWGHERPMSPTCFCYILLQFLAHALQTILFFM